MIPNKITAEDNQDISKTSHETLPESAQIYSKMVSEFHQLCAQLENDMDNRLDILYQLQEIVTENDSAIPLQKHEIDIFMRLYNDEYENDPKVKKKLSILIESLIYGRAYDYVDTFVEFGLLEVMNLFPNYHMANFLSLFLHSSFKVAKNFVELNCLDSLYDTIADDPKYLPHYIDCVAGIANYNAFETQLERFVPLLYLYINDDFIIENIEHIVGAFRIMADHSQLLFFKIYNDPKFQILNQFIHSSLENSDILKVIDQYIRFVGSMIGLVGVLDESTLINLFTELKFFLDTEDKIFILNACKSLSKGVVYESDFVNICFNLNILERCIQLLNIDDWSNRDKATIYTLLFNIFLASSNEQMNQLVNDNFNILSLFENLILLCNEENEFICMKTITKIIEIYNLTKNEQFMDVIDQQIFMDTITQYTESNDSEIQLLANQALEDVESIE
ncbi:hypothetical protein TVAG_038410 [Trichomonas vaginalis G3]|uniref:Uncharacterized protein n=1 Tax=Trichomonas vaginalis (strain ATCC PRA-98 / G3) TaxID=412133 RepID=A2DXZ8_TRIV3|nr:armadillo (ARM) repeat-containing protein family [Trichomonas vaginalis G3]EAY14734.1 hypothetical protein TVAG_038410 [Trichomonas vaginalis G3]KAI5487895.1 armadillo (ARM) repeat-containing protein family [Trichomonas vaginalis G3]|eukprot:XP_001326957.1 hypothetical protein [Trichomonas vaginalis G3]